MMNSSSSSQFFCEASLFRGSEVLVASVAGEIIFNQQPLLALAAVGRLALSSKH